MDKCPICQKATLDHYVSGVEGEDEPLWYECMNGECMFRCAQKYFDHITAAMELARAEAAYHYTLEWSDIDVPRERCKSAHKHVIEVFGGE
jgi:hypothetical protein